MTDPLDPAEARAVPIPLTFAQFSAVNRQRCESPDGFKHALSSWSTSDWFLAALGELGEAANIAKKLNRYRDGIPGNKEPEAVLRDKLRKELGDVFVYLDLLSQSLGVDIGAAAVEVFNAKSEEIGCSIRMEAAPGAAVPPPKTELERRERLALQTWQGIYGSDYQPTPAQIEGMVGAFWSLMKQFPVARS